MTTNKKMTKKDYFNTLLAINEVSGNQELVDFIKHEIELLENKSGGNRKPTANQLANDVLKDAILDGMEADKLYTVTDLLKSIPELADATNQKATSLVGQLVKTGVVEKVVDKRRSYFRRV